jgi:carbamoyltransferase
MRIGARNRRLGDAGYRITLGLSRRFCASRSIFSLNDEFAVERLRAVRAKLDRGETVYLAGINCAGMHNSGVALVEVTRSGGPKLICNNEEERFSGNKHEAAFPLQAIVSLREMMRDLGIGAEDIDAWLAGWDFAALSATAVRLMLEELPQSLSILRSIEGSVYSAHHFEQGLRSARKLAHELRVDQPVPVIGVPHHESHAWSSYCLSPFARDGDGGPVMITVLDGTGDRGAISLYVADGHDMKLIRSNDSVIDSLGAFYTIISSTQGGWTWLSSEGRYMGAAAFGNMDRLTNPYYSQLREIFILQPEGQVHLNRSLANWSRSLVRNPYSADLIRILGEPIPQGKLWNPDAVLRVEDIRHDKITKDRVDKAAATQLVFEDALFHIVDYLIKLTGSDRLVLTGGTALNAIGNMRLLEHFDEAFFQRHLGRNTRLHVWVPPTPSDQGVAFGAAFRFAQLAGAGIGPPIEHAFYCGSAPSEFEILDALDDAHDIAWHCLGNRSTPARRDEIADLMAFLTASDAIFAVHQGPAETGPRALGHRSIFANPCNPRTREILNERVKYREAIRPLAPIMTLDAAKNWFDLSEGASDDNYNAYNYMVLTARAKPEAYARIPSVIHADGTGRLQIAREHTDPLTYAYLKALGRRIGVEVAVNTSFNVAGPIAQTPVHAVETLRRAKGMDVVLLFANNGTVFAAWTRAAELAHGGSRFRNWLTQWQAEVGASIDAIL